MLSALTPNSVTRISLLMLSLLAISACGGGGDDDAEEPEQYQIGGTVVGLNGELDLMLKKNGSNWESRNLNGTGSNISFSFTEAQDEGINFAIEITGYGAEQTQNCEITSGGSGVLSAANANSTVITCSDITPSTGVFVDSPVGNIRYKTQSQSGATNPDGSFKYFPGETVTFSLGETSLPSAAAQALVTPLTLAETDDLNNNAVINMTRLLMSLDVDATPDNGLYIDDAVSSFSGSLDFSLPPADFASQSAVSSLLAIAALHTPRSELVSIEDAQNHLQQTLIALGLLPAQEDSCEETLVYQLQGQDIISQQNGELAQTPLSGTLTITPTRECTLAVNEGYSGSCAVTGNSISAFNGKLSGTFGNKEATVIVTAPIRQTGENVSVYLHGAAANSCNVAAVTDGQYQMQGAEVVIDGTNREIYAVSGTISLQNGNCSVQSSEGNFGCTVEGNRFQGTGDAVNLRGTISQHSISYFLPVVTSEGEKFYGQYSATRQ